MRVLLIEDDQRLARLIARVLTEEHMQVELANDGIKGLDLALSGAFAVAVIDWMLPGRDGPTICRAIRAARMSTALLLLTARGQVEDRVLGLDNGADDYLVKPFAFAELLARVRALSRRFAPPGADAHELRHNGIVLDLRAHTARRDDQPLQLTATEWKLLECFLRHPGQTLSRQQLLDQVWANEHDVQPAIVDVFVSYLRRKLHRTGQADPLDTVRGFGYRLRAPDV